MPHPLGADLLAKRLGEEFGAVVETCDTADAAIRSARRSAMLVFEEPHLVHERLVFVRRVLQASPGIILVVLEGEDSLGALPFLESGAAGFLQRGASTAELIEMIRAARIGHAILSPYLAGMLVRRVQDLAQLCIDQEIDVSRCVRLTDREREVAKLLSRQCTNEEISEALDIAMGTAKAHVHNILRKLDVESRNLAGIYWKVFTSEADSGQKTPT